MRFLRSDLRFRKSDDFCNHIRKRRCNQSGQGNLPTGNQSDGERRALDAAEAAISNPLLDDTSMKGATGVLINITGGSDMTLFEVDEAANRIRDEVDPEAHIIFGSTFDENIEGRIRVSIVATGMEVDALARARPAPLNLTPAVVTTAEPAPAATVVRMRPAAEDSAPASDTEDPATVSDGDPAAPAEMVETVEIASPTASSDADSTDATKPGDAFIPPAPADPSAPDETAAPDPFAAAAMANGATELESGATRKATKGSGLSLFERVTGTGRATKVAKTEKEVSVVNIEAPEPAPESIPAADESEQTQLGGMNPTDRLMASKAEEDLLDIPAFLRRQAN